MIYVAFGLASSTLLTGFCIHNAIKQSVENRLIWAGLGVYTAGMILFILNVCSII